MGTCLGIIADPIKNATNPIINVITKLGEGVLIDKIKKNENNTNTINGLKRWFFNILLLLMMFKKFSLGYKLLK
jgi:hypothetical protein